MPVPTSMTESRAGDGGSDADDSIPRGGPIFVPNMVSLLTRVSTFEDSVIQELQNLQTDLNTDSMETFDDEISVDELKIVTEEDLAIKAIEEVFKDDGSLKGSSLQNCRTITNKSKGINGKGQDVDDQENCAEQDNIAKDMKRNRINEESNNFEDEENCAENLKTAKKRKTMKGKNHNFGEDGSFDAKVEPFLKIKQKQEEEKTAARLHSFNGGLQKTNECETKSLDEIERMISLRSIDGVTKVNKSNFHGDHVPVIYPETVLCIEVYSNKHQARTKIQEFLVLGCQFLSELKDKIYCLTDKVMQKAEQHDPSGYFLIEDVFCNDMRDDKATDYSEPILDWLRNSKDEAVEKWEAILSGQLQKKQKALLGSGISSKLPCFRAVEMQKTRFCDLSFRVGAGYVYCHQGACKHIIVVRDMRLIHPKDVQNRRIYPIVTFQFKERLQKCSVCKICIAEKVTVDDKWAAENPCYFCRNCYYMLHYADGSLLYEEFSVYDYLHE